MEIMFSSIYSNTNKLCSSLVSSHVQSSSDNSSRQSPCFLPPTSSVLKLLLQEKFVLQNLCNKVSSATESFMDINIPLT